jgi:hypothetical protein
MTQNTDLHGNAPDNSPVALLLIDVINDLEFEGGEKLLRHALPAAKRIAAQRALQGRLRLFMKTNAPRSTAKSTNLFMNYTS